MGRDIFISYKNDNAGNNFASRLKSDLEELGYSVYFNSDESGSGDFPTRLRDAVRGCKDFVLIVSQKCLDQLMAHNKVDWIREEVLTAHDAGINIIPIMLSGVTMPADHDDMPEDLRFLPAIDNISMPERYINSPFEIFLKALRSKAEKDDVYRDVSESNPGYDVNADFRRTLADAESGDCAAMYEIAAMYFYGLSGDSGEPEVNHAKAYGWLTRLESALETADPAIRDKYYPHVHSMIAEMYYHGTVPRRGQSYEKALEHHRIAAGENGFSARESAYLTSRGCGCEFDYEKIVHDYKCAIENGDTIAINGLAGFYMNHGKFKEAEELYRQTSDIMPDAEFRLGMMYRDGLLSNPPKPDFFRAAFYFQHAISSGNCTAEVYHELGRLYFTPTGDFPKDFRRAQEYFTIASDMGEKNAQYKLGLMYEYGYVEKDTEKAIHYHTLAADRGSALAAYHLALLYQRPEVRNYHKACSYAKMAANRGVMEGEFMYGTMLYIGRGCEADADEAFKYLSSAYDHGMYHAKFMMEKIQENDAHERR